MSSKITKVKTIRVEQDAPEYLTVKDAAKYFGIGAGTIAELIEKPGGIGVLNVGKWRYVNRQELADYLKQQMSRR